MLDLSRGTVGEGNSSGRRLARALVRESELVLRINLSPT